MKDDIKETKGKIFLFYASTYYQILYTLIIIESLKIKDSSIILLHYLPEDLKSLSNRLETKGYKTELKGKPFNKNLIGRIKLFLSVGSDYKSISRIRRKYNEKELVLMNFAWNTKHIFYCANTYFKLCDSSYFFEEGAHCYSNYTGNKFEILIKRLIGDKFNYYEDEKLKRIFVTLPEKYPSEMYSKIAKISLFDWWNSLDMASKERVLKTFISNEMYSELCNLSGAGIIYTQPLSEDGYIEEAEKIRIYTEICTYYGGYGPILLKPHPRDTSTYSIQGTRVIERMWPSEILQFIGVRFRFAVGICTSAITGTDANLKINLNENYLSDRKLEMLPLEDFQ